MEKKAKKVIEKIKRDYIEAITYLMWQTDDIQALDLCFQLLEKQLSRMNTGNIGNLMQKAMEKVRRNATESAAETEDPPAPASSAEHPAPMSAEERRQILMKITDLFPKCKDNEIKIMRDFVVTFAGDR